MEAIIENSIKRFDIFRAILGLSLMFTSGYLWIKYFYEDNLSIAALEGNSIFLFAMIIFLFIIGIYLFIIGYTEMESNYDLDWIIKSFETINTIKKIKKIKLNEFRINNKRLEKFQTEIDNKIKDLIKEF